MLNRCLAVLVIGVIFASNVESSASEMSADSFPIEAAGKEEAFEDLARLAAADQTVGGGAAYAKRNADLIWSAVDKAFATCAGTFPSGRNGSTSVVLVVRDAGTVDSIALKAETELSKCVAAVLANIAFSKPPRAPFHLLFDEYQRLRALATADRRNVTGNAYARKISPTVRNAISSALTPCLQSAKDGRHDALDLVLSVDNQGHATRVTLGSETELGVCLARPLEVIRLVKPPNAPFRVVFDDEMRKLARADRLKVTGRRYLTSSAAAIRHASADALAKCSAIVPAEKYQSPAAVLVIDGTGQPTRVFAPGTAFIQCFADQLETLRLTKPPSAPFHIAVDGFEQIAALAAAGRKPTQNKKFVSAGLATLQKTMAHNFEECSKQSGMEFDAIRVALVLDANGKPSSMTVKPLGEMNNCIADAFQGVSFGAPPNQQFCLLFSASVLWEVSRTWHPAYGVSTAISHDRKKAAWALKARCSGCRGPGVYAQYRTRPFDGCGVRNLKSLDWYQGHKTKLCKGLGFDGVIPAGKCGGDYKAGGWCWSGAQSACKPCGVQDYSYVDAPDRPPTSVEIYDFMWYENGVTFEISGYGSDQQAALKMARFLGKRLRFERLSSKPPTKAIAAGGSDGCTHVDLRFLGWEQGSKTTFCHDLGFDGTRSYAGRSRYSDGGVCFIGPACDKVPDGDW